VVGGSPDKVWYPEQKDIQVKDNIILVDTVIMQSRIMFKRDLPEAVSHPACSIFDKKLLFIAGGMSKGEWISTIQIFDIEKCAMYPIKDKKLENFG